MIDSYEDNRPWQLCTRDNTGQLFLVTWLGHENWGEVPLPLGQISCFEAETIAAGLTTYQVS